MPIQPKPNRKRSIGVGLAERGTPFGIPKVKIEMVGVGHLPAPIHVGMNSLFLSFAQPSAPDRGSLLGRSDQDHAILARCSCGLQIRASQVLFVLSLPELHPGNVPLCRKAIDGLRILLADLAQCRRGWNTGVSLSTQDAAYQPDGLQVGDVVLAEDSI